MTEISGVCILPYTAVLGQRKSIQMRCDGKRLSLRVPLHMQKKQLENWILSKEDWIQRQVKRYENVVSEEDSLVLTGETKKIIIIPSPGFSYTIGDVITVKTKDDLEKVKTKILVHEARRILMERMKYWIAVTGLQPSEVKLYQMKRSWGRCDSKRRIRLNPSLVKCPMLFIDYVCVHELMHLRHMNHSAAFYRSIAEVMPDYKARIKAGREWALV